MEFSKEDQNTFLMVAAILVVCIVTLIVIVGIVWGIIQEPLKNTIENAAQFFQVNDRAIDYNFKVPIAEAQPAQQIVPEPQPVSQEPVNSNQVVQNSAIKYDLPFRDAKILGINSQEISSNALVQEVKKSRHLTGVDVTQVKFNVKVPSIGMNAPAMHGNDMEYILQNGFLIYPGSMILGDGSIILVCYRSQFPSNNPKSCWNLDKLQKDDEIVLDNFGSEIKYKIIGTNLLNFTGDFLYKIPQDKNYLQIITNDGDKRLVILASRE